MDGFEASARIRSHPRTQNTPILAATALYRDKIGRDASRAAATIIWRSLLPYRQLENRLNHLLNA